MKLYMKWVQNCVCCNIRITKLHIFAPIVGTKHKIIYHTPKG